MKAQDYLTQEMIDNLQADVDDNNGVIDWDDLEPLLDGFKKQLLIHSVMKPLPTKEAIHTVANNHALQYAYISDSDYEDYVKAIEYGANYIKKHIEKQK